MSTVVSAPLVGIVALGAAVVSGIGSGLKRLFGRSSRSEREMNEALSEVRADYNRQLNDVKNSAERNRIRMEKQMTDLQYQMARDLTSAVNSAEERSRARIAEVSRQSQQRMNQMESSMNSRISDLRQETREQLINLRRQQTEAIQGLENKVYNDMNNMHRQIDSRINDLADNMATIQRNLLGRISDVQENVDKANARIDRTNQHIDIVERSLHQLTDYVGKMEQRIDRQFQEQEQEIRNVQNELNNIHKRMSAIDDRGEERVKMALAWMEEVERNNDLDRFVPEEANQVRRRIQQLNNLGASGAELSAAANEAIIAAQELEIKCNRERLKYEQKEELTRSMLESLLETVNKLREIELTDDEGDPVAIENNFWSRGRYQALRERLDALKSEIDTRSETDMTMERLDDIQREIVEGETNIQEITSQSVARVVLSQARMQAISDIIEVMEDQHWTVIEKNGVEEIDYAGGETLSDFREGAFARLRNDMGEEVTIVVDPTDDETQNSLGFHFSGGMFDTDEENERKVLSVTSEIEKSGYKIGKPQCAGHMPMPEMDSADGMKQKGASQKMRERIKRQN